jgi:HipA-like protein
VTAALNVWMNGEYVGVWAVSRSGASNFQYDPQWVRSPSAHALSLPITAGHSAHRGDVVYNCFDNLLPDSTDIRRRSGAPHAWEQMVHLANDMGAALERVEAQLPEDFPVRVWEAVRSGARHHAQLFLREASEQLA